MDPLSGTATSRHQLLPQLYGRHEVEHEEADRLSGHADDAEDRLRASSSRWGRALTPDR